MAFEAASAKKHSSKESIWDDLFVCFSLHALLSRYRTYTSLMPAYTFSLQWALVAHLAGMLLQHFPLLSGVTTKSPPKTFFAAGIKKKTIRNVQFSRANKIELIL